MKDRPEALDPTASNKANDDQTMTDTESVPNNAEMPLTDEPPPKSKGRVMGSIKSLVNDFVDYTKKTEF